MNASRPRYNEDHWARDERPERALAKYLAQYDNPYSQSKADAFKRLLGTKLNGKRVLDYGGGAGYLSVYCATQGAVVSLVDIEKTALETARYYARQMGVSAGLECLLSDEFPERLAREEFDIVVAKDIIEHMADDDRFLRDVAMLQKPHGSLLLSTQNSLSLNAIFGTAYHRWIKGDRTWYGWDNTHLRFYTTSRIKKLLAAHGYRVVRLRGFYVLPYGVSNYKKTWARPAVVLSRGFDRCLGPKQANAGGVRDGVLSWNVGWYRERPTPRGSGDRFGLCCSSWGTRLHAVRLGVNTDRSIRTPASRWRPQQRNGVWS